MSRFRYRAPNVDRRYNDWHYTLPDHLLYIDVDGCEACSDCAQPLGLIETTANPEKSTRVLRNLAARAELPAWLVVLPPLPVELERLTIIRHKVIHAIDAPVGQWARSTLEDWGQVLVELHDEHSDRFCERQPRQGEEGRWAG